MAPFPSSVILLSLVSVALSNPLVSVNSENIRVNRYNPVRSLMDTLCTTFEASFCKGSISPATANHIVPKASAQNARAIPPLCEPSNFMDYRNFVDSRPFHSTSKPSSSKQECCLTCYDAGDCLSWMFNPTSLQCNFYTATTKAEDDGYESDVCPLGVNQASYEELPGYPIILDSSFGHNYGPCLGDAPVGGQKSHVRGEHSETSSGGEGLMIKSLSSHPRAHDL